MNRIADWLQDNTAALVFTPTNRKYLTGFSSSLGYLLITKNHSYLFVDGRYFLAAKQSVKNCRVEVFGKIFELLQQVIAKQNIKTLLVENNITVELFKTFNEWFLDCDVTCDGLTEKICELRRTKTLSEIDCVIKAQRIAERALKEILNFIKPGVSEKRIATELQYKMQLLGSEGEAFETICVSGKKSAMPHGVPSEKLIENGDFVTFDFGATIDGYRSDMTRTFAVGYVTDKMQTVYDTVLKAQRCAEEVVKHGVKCRDVDFVARGVIESAGFKEYFTHSTGHGIGLDVHEAPNVSKASETVLSAGDLISDEPGIYIEDEFGVRIEDMLFVTENGSRNLTEFEKSLIIL